jgi:hypothetical protein
MFFGIRQTANNFSDKQSHQHDAKSHRLDKLQKACKQVLHCTKKILFETAIIGQQLPIMQSFA